jgi:hypothetical protein
LDLKFYFIYISVISLERKYNKLREKRKKKLSFHYILKIKKVVFDVIVLHFFLFLIFLEKVMLKNHLNPIT